MMSVDDHRRKPETHQRAIIKFLILLAIMVGYFIYLAVEYNIREGGAAALITWSFFVLCTPIADAGFLIDFPLRLLFGIRMIVAEFAVWVIAISLNIIFIIVADDYYQTTALTKVFIFIIQNPYPYWGVVVLSALGTFLSVKFGDELIDVVRHKDRVYFLRHSAKHEFIVTLSIFVFVLMGYYALIDHLELNTILGAE